jgi:hypothetical protein
METPLMSMRCLLGFRVLVLAVSGSLLGCGGSATPKLAPVTGTIQVAGEPAAGVTVMFNPTGATKTAGAFGVTGPDGKYELVHRSGEKGIEPGTYTVSFSRMLMPDGKPLPTDKSPTDAGAVESIAPQLRTRSDTTEVKPEGGTFDFGIGAAKKK